MQLGPHSRTTHSSTMFDSWAQSPGCLGVGSLSIQVFPVMNAELSQLTLHNVQPRKHRGRGCCSYRTVQ